jgi:hypothetical protein
VPASTWARSENLSPVVAKCAVIVARSDEVRRSCTFPSTPVAVSPVRVGGVVSGVALPGGGTAGGGVGVAVGVGVGSPPPPTLTVPVMPGWTSQMNV